jgi:hypothetical protein
VYNITPPLHRWLKTITRGNIRRKRHEPIPPEALDKPFGSPPEEYRSRCAVCSAEMLVNEAIMAVAIGTANFHGEYTGEMSRLGCLARNGETLE